MKNYSILPTEENAAKLLRENPIGRNSHVNQFLQLLGAVEGNCSIALNGEWGSGKSVFARQVKLLLDYQNPQCKQSDELKEIIEPIASQFLECQSHATVYYDAWANDDHEDPILSLVYATVISGQSEYSAEKKKDIGDIVARIADVVTGRSIAEALKAAKGVDYLEPLKQRDNIHELVQAFLNELILEKANRLVIFVDELDRCRPAFAVQLLERIKHYFDDERVTFVFSVNLSQLQHTVKGYYGYAFDATRYLDKFFDLRLALPEVEPKNFIKYRFPFAKTENLYTKICTHIAEQFSFTLREMERYMRLTHIIVSKGLNKRNMLGFEDENARFFAFAYVVPVAIAISMRDMNAYEKFITGESPEVLEQTLMGTLNHTAFTYLGTARDGSQLQETLQEVRHIYNFLFSLTEKALFQKQGGVNIGEMSFSIETRTEVKNALTMLSEWADYNAE